MQTDHNKKEVSFTVPAVAEVEENEEESKSIQESERGRSRETKQDEIKGGENVVVCKPWEPWPIEPTKKRSKS